MTAAAQLTMACSAPTSALSQRLMSFLTRRSEPGQPKRPARKSDGKYSSAPMADGVIPDSVANAICAGYFASVCRMMGLDRGEAKDLLAQAPQGHFARRGNKPLMSAIYARQLAMYLASTEANLPQAQIARVMGLDRAGVHKALRSVEDLRDDHADYEQLIACVLVDVSMNGIQP